MALSNRTVVVVIARIIITPLISLVLLPFGLWCWLGHLADRAGQRHGLRSCERQRKL